MATEETKLETLAGWCLWITVWGPILAILTSLNEPRDHESFRAYREVVFPALLVQTCLRLAQSQDPNLGRTVALIALALLQNPIRPVRFGVLWPWWIINAATVFVSFTALTEVRDARAALQPRASHLIFAVRRRHRGAVPSSQGSGPESYDGEVFRVSFRRLAALRGSKATQLLAKLTPDLQEADELCEDNEGPLPSRVDALRQFVMGEPLVANYKDRYGDALFVICEHIGYPLDNSSVRCVAWAHLEAVDTAIAAQGIVAPISLRELFSRGLPVMDLPCPEPFPTVGFITPDEVLAARGRVRTLDWSTQPKDVQETIRQFHHWLEEAAGEGQGLIGFCE